MTKPFILFITNGNVNVGFGHISRSMTLADEFKSHNHETGFLLPSSSPFIEEFAGRNCFVTVESFKKEHAEATIKKVTKEKPESIFIIDVIEEEYDTLSWLRDAFPQSLLVSVTLFLFELSKRYEHLSFFPSMEQTRQKLIHSVSGKYKLCSGKDYLSFRKEFRNISHIQRQNADRILISMGGSDPGNFTLKVLNSIALSKYKISVVLTPVAPGFREVEELIHGHGAPDIRLIAGTDHIADEMCQHDIIILNGGITRYEACLAKIPFIAISLHQTQFNITRKLTDLGIGINLGIGNLVSQQEISSAISDLLQNYKMRTTMAQKMEQILDPFGAERIYHEVMQQHEIYFE